MELDAAWKHLLLDVCDPKFREAPPASERQIERLLVAAKAHGVLPVAVRRLCGVKSFRQNPYIRNALQDVEILTGQAMLLSHHGRRVAAELKRAGVRHTIVKGPSFATHLYPLRTDRPFTDVDFLIHASDIDRSNDVMRDIGYVLNGFENRPGEIYGEYKWEPPEGRNVLIELHTDLVHSPKFRDGVSLTYQTLQRSGDGNPEAPAALMLVAGLHASLGHQFERLQLLVDVLQAARNVIGQGAVAQTVRACRDAGAGLAVATALDLVARAFSEPVARELADETCSDRRRHVARILITPRLAASAQDGTAWRRSWRRKMYRQLLLRSRAGKGAS